MNKPIYVGAPCRGCNSISYGGHWHCECGATKPEDCKAETADLTITAEQRIERLQAEVNRCHARLEVDRVWIGDDTKAKAVPFADRLDIPDGIACRNVTIRILDVEIDRLATKAGHLERVNAKLMAALQRIAGGMMVTKFRTWTHADTLREYQRIARSALAKAGAK